MIRCHTWRITCASPHHCIARDASHVMHQASFGGCGLPYNSYLTSLAMIYIPLPNAEGRAAILSHLLKGQPHLLRSRELGSIVQVTEGYSASDLTALSKCTALSCWQAQKLLPNQNPGPAHKPGLLYESH
eukprot:1155987-Pelagomonas_calceolata.AAC.10